ncbi:hypothetical protein CAEBREN_13823 [Caenorhabditis brenneri]|uniref:Uncharacterized protein n=1 Tax=Caenorhabditis brenneri TaxID=135651 RepID=G0PKJ5_CAEBE|nr:hypothetical protein CAEBREN_13823 [Caenorhabditis brenneri]
MRIQSIILLTIIAFIGYSWCNEEDALTTFDAHSNEHNLEKASGMSSENDDDDEFEVCDSEYFEVDIGEGDDEEEEDVDEEEEGWR